ncbi:MAG: hypothetical protein ACOX8W_10920 [bacterium]
MLELYIAGTREKYIPQSLSITDAIGERTTCQFQIIDVYGAKEFRRGQPFEIRDNADVIAAGVIDSTSFVRRAGGQRLHTVFCVDWHYLADKRIAAKAYEDTPAGDIVKDLIDTYLAAEGITYTAESIQNGPVITEAVFNYVPVSRTLESLAEKAGFIWYIEIDKVLHFVDKATYAAPWAATASDMIRGTISYERSSPQYRNRQYIRGGRDITDPQTETKVGDGESRAFVVGYPIAKVPTVEVSISGGAYAVQTVGIRGLEENKNWYWNKGSNTVNQDDAGTVLTASDKVRITYQGEFDVIILSQNNDAITARQAIEGGGSGIVEDVFDDMNISSREAGFEIAAQKLSKYSVEGSRFRFRTTRPGLAPGQLLSITHAGYGLSTEEMLIEQVAISTDGILTYYDITAIQGPEVGSWVKLFAAMATRGEAFVVRENIREDQILTTMSDFSKDWTEAEQPNIFRQVRPSAALFPGVSTFPAFAANDRVKYLVFYNGGVELFRKAITQQTGEDTDEILSVTYIAPFEANGTITHAGWIGGYKATATAGTGVQVDLQAYLKEKTPLEALQINKTDRRWA